MEDYKELKMQIIDTKRSYLYTSSTIRPFNVQEYFPMRIDIAQEVLNNPLFAPPQMIYWLNLENLKLTLMS